MLNISQLAIIASTGIIFTVFIIAVTAMAIGIPLVSIKIHSKRLSKGKNKAQKKLNKEKKQQKTKNKEKVKEKRVEKTKSLKTDETYKKVATQKVENILLEEPKLDKSNLIGEEKVSADDLNTNSKYKFAYAFKIDSSKSPEHNRILSWKTSNTDSMIEALTIDSKFVEYETINKNIDSIQLKMKFVDETGNTISHDKQYNVGDYADIIKFKNDKKNLFKTLNSTKNANVNKSISNQNEQQEEQVL